MPKRTHAKPALPQSEDPRRVVIAHACESVYVTDRTGMIRSVIPTSEQILGDTPDALLGKNSFDFVHPDDVSLLRKAFTYVLRHPGVPVRREYRVRHHDGSWRMVEGTVTNLLAQPAVAGVAISARDMTDRKQAEAALREREAGYRQLVELCPDPFIVHSEEQLRYANAAATMLLGAGSAEQLIGHSLWDLIHPDFHDVVTQHLHDIRTEGRAAQRLALTFCRLDGLPIEGEMAGVAIMYAGKPAIYTVIRDITEQQRTAQALRDSEERYRTLFENANDAIATFTVDGIITSVNRGAERLLGWSRDELIGHHYRTVTTPAFAALADDRTHRFLAGEEMSSIFAGEFRRKDGRVVPVEARTRPIRDGQGAVIGFQGIYRDITERQQAERELRQSEERYRKVFALSPDFVYVTDAAGNIVDANQVLLDRTGLSLAQIRQRHVLDFFAGEHPQQVQQAGLTLRKGQEIQRLEVQARDAQGKVATYEINAIPLMEEGRLTQVLSLARDITERKQTELALRESEERYRIINQSISDYAFSCRIVDGDLFIEWLTDRFTQITGYAVEEVLDTPNPLHRYVHPEDLERVLHTTTTLPPGKTITYEFRITTKAGEDRWIESHAQAVADASGKLIRVYGAARDITARKQAEAELQESQRTRERIADTIPDILYVYALPEQRVRYVNRQIFSILGYPPEYILTQQGPLFGDLLHPDDENALAERTRHLRTATEGELVQSAFRLKHATGGWRSLRVRETIFTRTPEGAPGDILGVAQDITEQQKLEELLKERVTDRTGLPDRLRAFRRRLGLTQAKFGETFGGYSQAQISAYEKGEADVSLGLILAIRERGYPIETLIGGGSSDVIDKTVAYLPVSHHARVLARRLTAAVLQLLERDCQSVEDIMTGLGLSYKHLTVEQQRLLAQLLTLARESE